MSAENPGYTLQDRGGSGGVSSTSPEGPPAPPKPPDRSSIPQVGSPLAQLPARFRVWRLIDGKKPPVGDDGQPLPRWQEPPYLSFAEARALATQVAGGIGFVLGDGYAALDLDGCFDENGEPVSGLAKDIVEDIIDLSRRLDAYTDVSPSGRGLRALFRGPRSLEVNFKVDPPEHKPLGLFVTLTGDRATGDPNAELPGLDLSILRMLGPKDAPELKQPERKKVAEIVRAGGQNDDLRDRARALRGQGLEEKAIADALWSMVKSGRIPSEPGKEPWSYRHMEEFARRVCQKFEPNPPKVLPRATTEDFWMFSPSHDYIFVHTGDHWPGVSVDDSVPPIPAGTDKEGQPKYTKAHDWIARNRRVEQMTWYPGEPQIIEDKLIVKGQWLPFVGGRVFNLYRPPTVKGGDPKLAGPWLALLKRLWPKEYEHLLKWFAHRVQRPGTKVNHALVLGGAQGIGKDSALEPVVAAVGPWNVANVRPVDTLSDFNPFVKSVIVRVSELRDLGEMDRRGFYEHMKTYICAPPDVHTCNEKHLRQYEVPNVCGVVMTTNYADALFLAEDDRRHHVAWSDAKPTDQAEEDWTTYYKWLDGGNGNAHVAAFLLAYDVSDFNPKAPPPKTDGFRTMLGASRHDEDDDLAAAIEELKNPDALTQPDVESVASPELKRFLTDPKTARRTIGKRFEAVGYKPERNPDSKSGRWPVEGVGKVTVYVATSLVNERDRHAAVRKYQAEHRPVQGIL